MSLDRALESLLFCRAAREAFGRGDPSLLEATPDEIEALQTVDRDQLERASRLACTGILQRSHRGTGSLVDSFPRTIAAWRPGDPSLLDELADRFAESVYFAHVRMLPTGAGSVSLEEAFFDFAEASDIGDAVTRRAELVGALARTLVVTPDPSFRVPRIMRRAPRGYFAVLDGLELVAALDGRLLRGKITPLLAALLEEDAPLDEFAERFDVGTDVVHASASELRRLGLRR